MAGLLLVGVLLLVALGGTSTKPTHGPLPFDPLSQQEQADAVGIALEHQPLHTVLDRYETIGASLNTDKHRMRSAEPARMADVWFYEYTTDQTVWALIDLDASTLAEWDLVPYQPPLTAREMSHAAQLAVQDADTLTLLTPRAPLSSIEALARGWSSPPGSPCSENRCALVAFEIHGVYQGDIHILINLSLDRVEGPLALHAKHPDPHLGVHA
jgi:hypothetical protein